MPMSERASFAPVSRGSVVVFLIAALVLSCASRVSADDGAGDGLYGRFDGDVWLSAAIGGGGAIGDGASRAAGTLELRARFLDSVGPFAFVQGDGPFAAGTTWRIGGGLELRPLFLARFLTANTFGYEWLDVFLDSFGLELGVVVLSPDQRARGGLVLGTGLDVPILLGGLRIALRVGVRWTHVDHLSSGVQNDVTVLGALVVSAPVRTGLAPREGPRTLAE